MAQQGHILNIMPEKLRDGDGRAEIKTVNPAQISRHLPKHHKGRKQQNPAPKYVQFLQLLTPQKVFLPDGKRRGITFDDIVGFMVIFLYFHLAFPSKFDQNTPEKDLTFSYPRAKLRWLQTRWGGHLLSYRAAL